MLQRAASNAYSWWWASHIRTKQSKWLEHNLQDMEDKVRYTLKIINEDGDTFAKRAEMYYRKRPEIVNFVEEAFRSYRALAERYDHLSTELQSANHMIATAFPDHVQFPLGDDDDDDVVVVDVDDNEEKPSPNIPEIPKKEFKSQSLMLLSRKEPMDMKRSSSSSAMVSSGLSKEEALLEIDKIHKGILVLQTEKEFVRSSYEQAYDKYWGLENEVVEMQKRVCGLQDEFGVGGGEIEDGEARTLVASTALSSCQETISKLEETQKRIAGDAETEKEKIDTAAERFEALRNKFEIKLEGKASDGHQEPSYDDQSAKEVDLDEKESDMEFAEKIDELVEKVVSLETTASSHTALVKTLRSETDELHEHIRGVEEDKACIVSDSIDTKKRVTALEDELSKVKSLFQRVEDQNKNLQEHLSEANSRAKDLSGKLEEVKMDEDGQGESDSISKDTEIKSADDDIKEAHSRDQEQESETESSLFGTEVEDEERRNWTDGMEDREKVIVDEYASVLKDYREVKRRLSQVEKKNRDGFFELALQLRELKNAVSSEDFDFHLLRQRPELPGKDSPHPVERNRPESVTISHSSNSSISMVSYQQVQRKEDEVKVKFATDIDDSIRKRVATVVEGKIRGDIDTVLEENIEFWLRFSTSVHQLQKYQTAVQDLKAELSKLRSEDSAGSSSNTALASETKPIHRHLRDIRTELQLWLENSAVLRDELEGRYATLCNIKDEVSKVTSQSDGTNTEISGYQAARFHGVILNMKQENKKVFNELQAGLDRARALRTEVERVVSSLEEDRGVLNAKGTRSMSKSTSSSSEKPRIPLRSFLFGVKIKKYKQPKQTSSIFGRVSPSPAMQKQCSYITPTCKDT